MSDKLLCPFCGQGLNTEYHYIRCYNPHCNKTAEMEGTEELWQALITTRKALDVAVDALKKTNDDIRRGCDIQARICIDKALEQITALEQKNK